MIDYHFFFKISISIIISFIITHKVYKRITPTKINNKPTNNVINISLIYTQKPKKIVYKIHKRKQKYNQIVSSSVQQTVEKRDVIKSGSNSYDIKNDYQVDIIIKIQKELSSSEIKQLERNFTINLTNSKMISSSGDMGLKNNSLVFMICQNDTIIAQSFLLLINEHDLFGLSSKINNPDFGNLDIDLDTVILYNLSVNEGYRNRGYGIQLLTFVEDWCIKNNKHHICLFVAKDNRSATNLYLKKKYAMMPYYTDSNEIMMKKSLTIIN